MFKNKLMAFRNMNVMPDTGSRYIANKQIN